MVKEKKLKKGNGLQILEGSKESKLKFTQRKSRFFFYWKGKKNKTESKKRYDKLKWETKNKAELQGE